MGGVGKTTLLKKIHNKFADVDQKKDGGVDILMWITVSHGANTLKKVQDEIAKKLHLYDERRNKNEWTNKSESDKAAEKRYTQFLNGKRFVLMLDDIWEKVDLETVGVPEQTRENGCKVAFTTRSREVSLRMEDREPMEVKCLEPEEAWESFEKKVGVDNLARDSRIMELARKVAEKCSGLPLALIVIMGACSRGVD